MCGGRQAPKVSQIVRDTIRELVTANRILSHEGVVDALGHVSMRHPENAGRYLLACSRSPGLVTEDDIMEFDLDSNPIGQRGRSMYAERPIHGCMYRARPDVNAICHSHAPQLIPFTVTGIPIKPVWVMGAAMGEEVPLWDIREDFPHDDGMLIVNNTIGSSMARRFGAGRTCLLAGHGAVIVETTIRRVVAVAIGLVTNAEILMHSRTLILMQDARDVRYLTSGEVRAMAELIFNPRALERMWDYWATRAGHGAGETAR
jgi:ribulose-5-phosphate 4-epimerase/fuculose-1-phosphate aldolase